MLSDLIQSEGQDLKPPGIFRPVLGQVQNQDSIQISASFKSLNQKQFLILDLYQDRIVRRNGQQSHFLLLNDEIYFKKSINQGTVEFVSQQACQAQIFITENLIQLELFCDKLRLYCPQTNFTQHYKFIQPIGKGKGSEVFKVQKIDTGAIYAVKRSLNSSFLKKQLDILRQLRHPNIIYFQEFFIDSDHFAYIVMNFEDGGNLFEIISKNQMTPKKKNRLMKDLLSGLQFLRIKGIIHRDLKPENILYSQAQGTFKIADFGFAVRKNEAQNKIVGTPGYLAPEMFKILKGATLNANVYMDIYSAGLIFYEAFTNRQFYQAKTEQELLKNNMKGMSFKNSNASKIQIEKLQSNILRKMIRKDPQNRKDSYQIMQSQSFNTLNKAHGIDILSNSTASPTKRNSNSSSEDQKIFFSVKTLLKMRSSSN